MANRLTGEPQDLSAYFELIGRRGVIPDGPDEGHRERKKRLTRQQISDTATGMFIERGFDDVRVADVAEACGVSEKTVYNYFPTKESLLLDREDDMIAAVHRALGPAAMQRSPIEAVVGELLADIERTYRAFDDIDNGEMAVTFIRRFSKLVESTPSLRAAQRDMMDRIAGVAALVLAERAGVDPTDPEPQIAARAIVDLFRIEHQSMNKHSDGLHDPAEVRDLVTQDVRRAARLIDTGLWSFNLMVQTAGTRQQMQAAADAAKDTRRQVVAAIKAARSAWRDAAEVRGEDSPHHNHASRFTNRAD